MTTHPSTEPSHFAAEAPFTQVLRTWRDAHPARLAVVDDERSITRAQLESTSNRLARDFAARGVTADSFVTIALPNGVAFFETVLAVWKLGATPQPVSARIPEAELQRVLELSRPALIVGRDCADIPSVPTGYVPEALDDGPLPTVVSASWKAPMSGGSTGRPKLIVSTAPARYGALAPIAPLVRMAPRGVSLISTPLSHNMGLLFGTLTLITGGTVVVMPRFDAGEMLRLLDEKHVTWTVAVPTMLHRISRLPEADRRAANLEHLGAIAVGASVCPQPLKEFWVDWVGPERMIEFYSTTENQVIVIADGTTWTERPGSVGCPVVGEIEVRDEDGTRVADGQVGELWMRRGPDDSGPYRYLGAVPQRDSEGWETVGDMGYIDEGFVYLADRKADMVVVGGNNVYPAEVEAALEEHPAVLSSCVVGLPHDELGSSLTGIVQTVAPVSDQELIAHLRTRLLPYKIPRRFERADGPLRDDAGKLRRGLWRDTLLPAASAPITHGVTR